MTSKDTRFQKGVSGNRKGRPQGARNKARVAAELLLDGEAEALPTYELVVNIRTGPTSIMSVAVYPSYESAASNIEVQGKFLEEISAGLKDSFFHEGEVAYLFQSELKPQN